MTYVVLDELYPTSILSPLNHQLSLQARSRRYSLSLGERERVTKGLILPTRLTFRVFEIDEIWHQFCIKLAMRSIQRLYYHIYGWGAAGQPRTHSCHHHYLLIPPPSHLVPYLARPFGSFMFLGVNFAVEGVPCTPSTWDCPSIPKVDPLARYKPTLGTWAKKKIFAEPEPKRVRNPIGHLYDHLEIEGILLHQSIALSILDSMHLVLTLNS